MEKHFGEFTVKLSGNDSLITVYKNNELVKGISVPPATLDNKFKEVCDSVEKHVTNNQSK